MPRGDYLKKFGTNIVPFYEKGKYDLAILHIDQQCMSPGIWNDGKGSLYRELKEVITDIPIIVINHGTPYYPEEFSSDIRETTYKELGYTLEQVGMSSLLIEKCKQMIGDNVMVTNSKKASRQWGRGIPIWHGLDHNEWWDLPKEPRVVTMVSPGGLDKYYDRKLLSVVKEGLLEQDIYHCHITVDTKFSNWDEYRDFLGRSLIYFNHTAQSPMPRSRTEAMLSGCCVISTANQDADTFLKNGYNAMVVKREPDYVVKLIKGLIKNYKTAIEIGQRGKETAKNLFSKERYDNDWRKLLEAVIDYHKEHGTTKGFKIKL